MWELESGMEIKRNRKAKKEEWIYMIERNNKQGKSLYLGHKI